MQLLYVFALVACVSAPPSVHFGSSANDPSDTCQAVVDSLASNFPTLPACYKSSTLYFSTPAQVCSPDCLDVSIKASQAISKSCVAQGHQNRNEPKFLQADVYANWSNEAAALAACAVPESGRGHCLNRLERVLMHAQYEKLGIPLKDDPYKLLGCAEECLRNYYRAVHGNGAAAPTLYYFGGEVVTDLFASWKKHCKW